MSISGKFKRKNAKLAAASLILLFFCGCCPRRKTFGHPCSDWPASSRESALALLALYSPWITRLLHSSPPPPLPRSSVKGIYPSASPPVCITSTFVVEENRDNNKKMMRIGGGGRSCGCCLTDYKHRSASFFKTHRNETQKTERDGHVEIKLQYLKQKRTDIKATPVVWLIFHSNESILGG